jgi:hypothetical protein
MIEEINAVLRENDQQPVAREYVTETLGLTLCEFFRTLLDDIQDSQWTGFHPY